MGLGLLFSTSLAGIATVLLIGQILRGGRGGPGVLFLVLMSAYFLVVLPWQHLRRAGDLRERAARVLHTD